MKPLELVGKRFGRLTVIRRVEKDAKQNWQWLCVCDHDGSGEPPTQIVAAGGKLMEGAVKSCGCLRRDTSTAHGKSFLRHGMSKHPLYQVWRNMKARCYDPKRKDYKDYGGRGIRVCRDWLTSDNFFAWAGGSGYKPGLTIECRNNDKNYSPRNCFWETRRGQIRNRRNTLSVIVDGKRITLAEACEVYGIKYSTVMARRSCGWDLMDALTSPVDQHNRRYGRSAGALVGK